MKDKIKNFSYKSIMCFGLVIYGKNTPICALNALCNETIHCSQRQFNQDQTLANYPVSCFLVHYVEYSIAYDARNKNPLWVYEHLTEENIQKKVSRSHIEFKEDHKIYPHLRSTSADYKGQGFDRGHMAAAANHCSNTGALNDTFYMTNLCPQSPPFNRGYWRKLEKYARDLTKEHKNVYVVSGPLYLPQTELDGRRFVKYQVIGLNDVAVPTHFFKVITCEDWQGRKETQAFILPNTNICSKVHISDFKTTVEKVERAAGIIINMNN